MKRTLMEVLTETAARYSNNPALCHKVDNTWITTTWKEYQDQILIAARAFMALGLEPKGCVAIIGNNCPQWLIADIAAIFAGAVPAGIYATNSPQQCHYIAEHCEAAIAVVEDKEQLDKFKKIRDTLPNLKAIVMMNGSDPDENIHSWEDLPGLAEKTPESELTQRIDEQKPDDLCTLIYTSGTTGNPKGVMLSHDNLTWTIKQVIDLVGLGADDRLISYLPLSHIAEQLISIHGPMARGACTYFAESLEKLPENLQEVRPTIFLGVPRVWEKIQAKMMDIGAQNSPLKKKISAWARTKGLAGGYAKQEGKPNPALYGLANKLVFSKVRDNLGLDQCRIQLTGAAPISKDTLEFFLSLGIPIYEVYGMSESTGLTTISTPDNYHTGKAGFALPDVEVKIADDGEILFRGRHVCLGYFKNEEATAETLDSDNWLHSGDIGEFDTEGFLQVTDRKKELIITAGGENIAPQLIEGMFKAIPIVNQFVVIGDRRKYLSALITLDPEKLPAELETAGSPARDSASAATCDKFRAHMQKQIDDMNASLARVQTIKKFVIIPEEFSIEGGEMTPTMKMKRKVINEKYTKEIESLYA
jgi:long-subunit acyl-CoA synthetase (AMP-forming)